MNRRIGVYICHCGNNIAATVDVEKVTETVSSIEGVVVAKHYLYMCSDPGQDLIREDIKRYGLNSVVVASCSPLLHEKTFKKVCESAGLSPFLYQHVNIREQCSWVHDNREKATEKAIKLVVAGINRVKQHVPLKTRKVPVTPAVLVVGGGIAGIEAALTVADAGRKVYLVEKEPSIGGHMAQLDKTFPTLDCSSCILTPKMSAVGQHENIELLTYSEVVDVSGFVGNYIVKIKKKARFVDVDKCTGCGTCQAKCPVKVPNEFDMKLGMRKAIYTPFPQAVPNVPVIDTEHCLFFTKGICKACEKLCPAKAINFEQKNEIVEVKVGAIIVATGYDVFDPSVMPQYGYGVLDNVITSLEFERLCSPSGPTVGKILLKNGKEPETVAIIHCVGSRDKNFHEYCSRVCCMYSMKIAHLIKEEIPDAKIYEFYIDIRAFGKGYEEFYRRVLSEGVTFIRGKVAEVTDVAEKPEEEGKLIVQFEDTLLGTVKRIPVDMVVLAVALEPRKDSKEVAKLFSLNLSNDGFFLEKHPKLAPVSTANDGIFIAGTCQGPKDIPDTVAQASAAAAQALSLIDRGEYEIEAFTAEVNEEICSGCKACISVCPFEAITFDEEKKTAVVQEELCKGCGACSAACRSGAIQHKGYTHKQVFLELEGLTSYP